MGAERLSWKSTTGRGTSRRVGAWLTLSQNGVGGRGGAWDKKGLTRNQRMQSLRGCVGGPGFG